MPRTPIYLDYQATTPVDERVVQAMLPYFTVRYGNAASKSHSFGWTAEIAVDQAREQVAALVGGAAPSMIFTSGATEANNMAIRGIAEAYRSKGKRIVTAATEHSSVIDVCAFLGRQGFEIVYLPVDSLGRIDLAMLESALTEHAILVSVMIANNEIGTLHPVAEIGELCKAKGVLFHTDATQAVGKLPIDVSRSNIDLLSFSAHKIYGPKGVGALHVRQGPPHVHLTPLLHGGGHERGMRSGTLNVPGIVGFGAAAEILVAEGKQEAARINAMTTTLLACLRTNIAQLTVNGDECSRLPGNLNLRIEGISADALMRQLRELAFSTGSACSSGMPGPSHVLKAIGLTQDEARQSFRLSIGRNTTDEEIAYVCKAIAGAVRALR